MASASRRDDDLERAASIVHIAFKDDATHFIAATDESFRVFSCTPLKGLISHPIRLDGSAVTCAELRSRTELAFVTRKQDSYGQEDTIRFWDQLFGPHPINEQKSTCGAVRGLRLLGDYMIVAGEETATMYISGRRERDVDIDTGPNPLGLCALARSDQGTLVYALPRPEKGAVQVRRRRRAGSVEVRAHASSLTCLALSRDGRLLATAGSRGTLVRIFSTTDGTMVQELRRGIDRADIHCIAFSPDSKWLAVTSDKGTVHVFCVNVDLANLKPEDADDTLQEPIGTKASKGSYLSSFRFRDYLPGLPSYFNSEWSFAQFRDLPDGKKYLVAFGQLPHTILIIGMDGRFHRCQFDPEKGGKMTQLEYRNFMKLSDEKARK